MTGLSDRTYPRRLREPEDIPVFSLPPPLILTRHMNKGPGRDTPTIPGRHTELTSNDKESSPRRAGTREDDRRQLLKEGIREGRGTHETM